jgi:hypothetical protein
VAVDHVLDAVGDQLAAGQRVEHAAVAHRDAVVDGDRVELLGDAAGLGDRARDEVAHVLEVHVAGHELGVGVGDRDDRLAEVAVGHAGGAPERTRSGGVAAVGGDAGAIGWHRYPRIDAGSQPALRQQACLDRFHRIGNEKCVP